MQKCFLFVEILSPFLRYCFSVKSLSLFSECLYRAYSTILLRKKLGCLLIFTLSSLLHLEKKCNFVSSSVEIMCFSLKCSKKI